MSDINQHNLRIDTPENVILEVEVVGLGTRSAAALIDYIIIVVLLLVFNRLFGNVIAFRSDDGTFSVALLILIQFILLTFYHLLFELMWNGQTPGKRLVKARVVQADGMPANTTAIMIRNLVRLFDFLPALYGVGLAVMFASRRSQRLGDMAADTVVVREQPQLTLDSVKESTDVKYQHIHRADPLPEYILAARLSQQDYSAVINYLQRRESFQRRDHLAVALARKAAAEMGLAEQLAEITEKPRRAEMLLEQIALSAERREQAAQESANSTRDS